MAALALMGFAAPVAARDLVVMSFNVRYPNPDDGPDVWEKRQGATIAAIRKAAPDIMGTQELFQRQGDAIVAALPQYRWFGTDRRGGHADEHMGVFYRQDRFELVEQGQFWLSDTPEVVGSITWGQPLPRMVTWGLFAVRRGKDKGRRFYLVNTHFPYREADTAARTKAAQLVARWIDARPAPIPVILTGDFNTGPDSAAHARLTQSLTDTWTAAPGRRGPAPGYHGFAPVPAEARIDWVLERGMRVVGVHSPHARYGGHYPSDHYPMVARLAWPASPSPASPGALAPAGAASARAARDGRAAPRWRTGQSAAICAGYLTPPSASGRDATVP
ncbi:endonuclease/exonuclease/phosphatase family protein [Novosphingobium organovorum]